MERLYHDADWLRRRYHADGATQLEIAEECDVSPRTIRTWMQRHEIETRDVRGENHGLYGKKRSEDVKERISKTLIGREFDDEWRERISEGNRGRSHSDKTRERISAALEGVTRSDETRRKMSESTAGEANPNWRGGHDRRYGPGWGPSRTLVVERDEVCQNCGEDGSNRRLHVHHIIPVRVFRETEDASLPDAHDVANLVLLCNRCHGKADHGTLNFVSGVDDPRE